MPRAIVASLAVAVAALASRAAALDVAEGKLTVAGFGHWGYGETANENVYLVGDDDGRYDNAQFSLAVTAYPEEALVVAGQVFLTASGEATLDWAFAEYRLHDLARVRAGKVKNPLGIFMEVKDVGTLRPFFSLPQSIYGAGNLGAESYVGAGITGEWQAMSGWGLAYDAYVGALAIAAFEPTAAPPVGAGGTAPPFDFSAVGVEEEEATDVLGGRVVLTTPVDGLTFRLSGYTGKLEEDEREATRIVTYGASAEYALEDVQLRGELFRSTEGDVETNVAGYVEVAWTFLPRLQAAARYERARQEKEGVPDDSPLLDHDEVAFGLAYWPSPNLVVKASYHRVEGNRFAVPALSADDGSVPSRTDLFVAGAQFSF